MIGTRRRWAVSPAGRALRLAFVALLVFLQGVFSLAQPALAEVAAPQVSSQVISVRVLTAEYLLDETGVTVEHYPMNDLAGAPRLPFWSTEVELPPDSVWWIEYESPGAQRLAQTALIPAAPVPDASAFEAGLWFDDAEFSFAAPTLDRPDPAIYGVDAFYPQSPVVPGDVQWQRGQRLLALRVFPFQYNPVTRALNYHPDLQIRIYVAPGEAAEVPAIRTPAQPSNAPASTAGALRIRTASGGLHRLTYNDLVGAGVPLASVDPATFAMHYLGQPVAIHVMGDGDARFEPDELVVFYAQPYQGRYQTSNVYWFTYGAEPGLRMAERTVTPTGSEPLITTITQTLHVELDSEYRTQFPLPQDADHWFDWPLSPDSATAVVTATRTYDLALDDALTGGTLRIRAALHGGANHALNPDKSIAITLNDHYVATHQWEGMTYTIAEASAPAAWLDGAPNRVHLTAAISQLPGIAFYSVVPDWVQVSYPALADAENNRIDIEGVAEGANRVAVSGFSTSDAQVYELRDPNRPVRILAASAEPAGGGYTLSFWDADLPGPTYALSTPASLLAPLAIEPDTPSTWGAPGHEADYIAVVHRSLWDAIDPLLAHRAAEGMAVAKVDVQDIYDEWSYGRRDPEAIRSFLSYAYRCWNSAPCDPPPASPPEPPQYVLLVGDGHYDFTGASGTAFPNLIPPYLAHVDPWMGETLVDNRYVSVDGPADYLPDMAIGRIPANTPAEAAAVIDKIIAYETAAPSGSWQERVVYVADRNNDPAYNFHALSDHARLQWLPAGYDDRTIYYNLDYFTGPEMRAAVKTAFNGDAFMMQWFGHASRYTWGAFVALNYNDPPTFNANDTWPFTVHYTCYSGYFGNLAYGVHALSEILVHTPQRGSVADLSSSGANLGSSLQQLNQGVTKAVFRDRIERAGQAVTAAKRDYFQSGGGIPSVIDTFVYFGDPALKLRLPESRLAGSTLEASRAWAPPGMSVAFTATLTTPASATAQLSLDLPANLDAPTALGATSSSAVYDPALHRVTWSGAVAPGAAEVVTFTSALAAGQQSCGAAAVSGQVLDDLAAPALLSASMQVAAPDVDCDGDVDVADVQQVAARWGALVGDPAWHPRFDLDGDDQIGVLDIIVVASLW